MPEKKMQRNCRAGSGRQRCSGVRGLTGGEVASKRPQAWQEARDTDALLTYMELRIKP